MKFAGRLKKQLNTSFYNTTQSNNHFNFSVFLFLVPIIISVLLLKLLNVANVSGDYDPDWGVLALNTDKSVYHIQDMAHIEYAVLDVMGKMDCSADLSLEIYTDGTRVSTLSTDNGQIKVHPDCQNKQGAEGPDFSSDYIFRNLGEYELILTANTTQGSHSISKTVQVVEETEFDVQRKSFTRIFPRNEYRVDLIITANKNFVGTVEELVPSSFGIKKSPLYEIKPYSESQKKIVWNVNWEKNNVYELSYVYQAPLRSPDFYEIGPLSLNYGENIISKTLNLKTKAFKEASTWQIASDDLLNHYSVTCNSIGAKAYTNPTNAQGSPTLGSSAALASFTTSNSAVGTTSDAPDLECDAFTYRDLGTFNSANIVFSAAVEGQNNGDDYLDVNYSIGASVYDLTTIPQDTSQGYSNATNGGYWSYSAPNVTSWADISNTLIHFEGVKTGSPDRNDAFIDATWIEVDYTPRTYTQNDFEWFVPQGSVTLTNAWPTGNGDDLTENEVFTQFPASNEAMISGDQIRLQMNFTVGAANLPTTIEAFKLQYVAAEDCAAATGWADVGAKASGTIWRMYDETALADEVTQVNQISTSDSGAEGYFTELYTTSSNPNAVNANQNTEWDWALENNGATDNTTYCFRMAVDDEFVTFGYASDGYPKLTTAPGASNVMRHGNIFQNDLERGMFWAD